MSEMLSIIGSIVSGIISVFLTVFILWLWDRYKKKKGKEKMFSNRTKNLIFIYVWIGLTIAGIIIFIWILLAIHLIYALMFAGFWGFFLISPFVDWESREDAARDKRDRDKRKNLYKRKRGWE